MKRQRNFELIEQASGAIALGMIGREAPHELALLVD